MVYIEHKSTRSSVSFSFRKEEKSFPRDTRSYIPSTRLRDITVRTRLSSLAFLLRRWTTTFFSFLSLSLSKKNQWLKLERLRYYVRMAGVVRARNSTDHWISLITLRSSLSNKFPVTDIDSSRKNILSIILCFTRRSLPSWIVLEKFFTRPRWRMTTVINFHRKFAFLFITIAEIWLWL